MYRWIAAIAFVCSPLFAANNFPQAGRESVQNVKQALQKCGLVEMDAYDPRLPRPQVPADTAILNQAGALLAYYIGTAGFQAFKTPNGVHSVSYGRQGIQWVTPYFGTVAHGNRFMTVAGPGYNLYCNSVPVNYAGFQACVQQGWVDVIVNQLCRAAGG